VVLSVPEGWAEVALPPPDLSQAVGVRLLAWNAWAPPGASGVLPNDDASGFIVAACFGGSPGTWTEEAEPLVLDHLHGMVSGTALRIARVGELRTRSLTRESYVTHERLEGRGSAEHVLSAEVFLGFVEEGRGQAPGNGAEDLVGCFALCTGDQSRCADSVAHAAVAAEFVPPPPATLSIRALLAAVHHPSTALAVAVALSLLFGATLVLTRRRPRTK
jgi:hypothetical protein